MSNQNIYSKLNGVFLILIGLVFVVLSFYVDDNIVESSNQSSKLKKDSRKSVDLINKHLLKSYDKEIMDNMNVINQNRMLAPKLKDAPEETRLSEEEISALYGGTQYEEFVRKELNEKNAIQDKIYQKELEDKEIAEKEEVQKRYRQKYAQTFIERARKDGYEVELDEDLRIKSVNKTANQMKSDDSIQKSPRK
jgi:hypothetical protein